ALGLLFRLLQERLERHAIGCALQPLAALLGCFSELVGLVETPGLVQELLVVLPRLLDTLLVLWLGNRLLHQLVHSKLQLLVVLNMDVAAAVASTAFGVDQVRADVEAGGLLDDAVGEEPDMECLRQGDAGAGADQDVPHGDAEPAHVPAHLAPLDHLIAAPETGPEVVRSPVTESWRDQPRITVDQ